MTKGKTVSKAAAAGPVAAPAPSGGGSGGSGGDNSGHTCVNAADCCQQGVSSWAFAAGLCILIEIFVLGQLIIIRGYIDTGLLLHLSGTVVALWSLFSGDCRLTIEVERFLAAVGLSPAAHVSTVRLSLLLENALLFVGHVAAGFHTPFVFLQWALEVTIVNRSFLGLGSVLWFKDDVVDKDFATVAGIVVSLLRPICRAAGVTVLTLSAPMIASHVPGRQLLYHGRDSGLVAALAFLTVAPIFLHLDYAMHRLGLALALRKLAPRDLGWFAALVERDLRSILTSGQAQQSLCHLLLLLALALLVAAESVVALFQANQRLQSALCMIGVATALFVPLSWKFFSVRLEARAGTELSPARDVLRKVPTRAQVSQRVELVERAQRLIESCSDAAVSAAGGGAADERDVDADGPLHQPAQGSAPDPPGKPQPQLKQSAKLRPGMARANSK